MNTHTTLPLSCSKAHSFLQFTGFPTSRLHTMRRSSVFLNLEHSAHRAPLCRLDWCDGFIQLKSSNVDTNFSDTDSHSHGAELNGCWWNVLKTSTVRHGAPVSLRVPEFKCCSWATLTHCFFFDGSVVPDFELWMGSDERDVLCFIAVIQMIYHLCKSFTEKSKFISTIYFPFTP